MFYRCDGGKCTIVSLPERILWSPPLSLSLGRSLTKVVSIFPKDLSVFSSVTQGGEIKNLVRDAKSLHYITV